MDAKIRKRKDRGNVFYIEGTIFGQEVRESTFTKDQGEAELIFARFVEERKKAFLGGDATEPTFNEVAIVHINSECKKSVDKDFEYIHALKPYIGNLPFNKIKRVLGKNSALTPFIKQKAFENRSITTVNKHLSFLNTLGNKARVKYDLISTWNPVLLLSQEEGRKFGLKPPVKKKHLTREMETILINHLPEELREPVIVAINTGFRENLLCGLKWDWLKKDSGTVWFFEVPKEEMKNFEYLEEDQVFVLNSIARKIIQSREHNGSEYVFPHPSSKVKSLRKLNTTSYRAARVRGALQIPDLKETDVHSFRRTFATRLAEKMIPYDFIQRLLGHKIQTQTEDYIRYSPVMRARFYDYVELIVGEQAIKARLFASK